MPVRPDQVFSWWIAFFNSFNTLVIRPDLCRVLLKNPRLRDGQVHCNILPQWSISWQMAVSPNRETRGFSIVDTSVTGCFLEIAAAERFTNIIQLTGFLQGQIR